MEDLSCLPIDAFTVQELLNGLEVDYGLRSKAGSVVEPGNYEKRVRVLVYQLPNDVIESMENAGSIDDFAEWKLGVWRNDAMKFLPKQERYTVEDVLNAYREYELRVEGVREIEKAYV